MSKRIKKKKIDIKLNNGIINFYDIIPDKYKQDNYNPNYNEHKLSIPARFLGIAPQGAGKTNFLLNLITAFSKPKGTFADIWIITKNKDEPLYNYLEDLSEDIHILEGVESIPKMDDFDKYDNHLVVFDDLVLEKNQKPIEDYFIRSRKFGITCVYLSQTYYGITKKIRINSNYIFILKVSNINDLKYMLREYNLGLEMDTLLNMYRYATNEKFSTLFIDTINEDYKFRKGLSEILNPNDF